VRVLGIETSTMRGDVALAEEDRVLASIPLPHGSRPTASLLPAIAGLCRQLGWQPRTIGRICVDIGPGSYTGLRVGLTCAKTLAFAGGASVSAVRSLDVTAAAVPPDAANLEIAFDAARGQVFAARYAWRGDRWQTVAEIEIANAQAWAARLDPGVLVAGPALERYRSLVPAGCRIAADELCWPRAAQVIQLGLHSPPAPGYWTMEPLYMRPSAAEEKKSRESRVESPEPDKH
jgi:tRNA threonylcarbamoyladenosine biosynthesis protein TsaB